MKALMKALFLLTTIISVILAQTYLSKDGPIPICDFYTEGVARSGDNEFWKIVDGWKNIISSYPVRPNAVTKVTFQLVTGNYFMLGCANMPDLSYVKRILGTWPNSHGFHTVDGNKYNNGLLPPIPYAAPTKEGDNITMTIDLRPMQKTVSYAKNGLSLGVATGGLNFWSQNIYIVIGLTIVGNKIKVIDYQVVEGLIDICIQSINLMISLKYLQQMLLEGKLYCISNRLYFEISICRHFCPSSTNSSDPSISSPPANSSDYTTTTGGLCSTAIITILIILSASMGIKTLKKEIIITSSNAQHQLEPSQLKFTTDKDGGLMFGIYIMGYNFTTSPKLFEYTLHQESYTIGHVLASSVNIPLVQCTVQHYNFSSQLVSLFYKLQLNNGLCPPLGQEFSIKGKISGDFYNQVKIVVKRCNSTVDPTCANDSVYAAIEAAYGGNFDLVFAVINRNINPSQQIYLQEYLDDRNIFSFSSQLGIRLNADVQSDTIETDQSLIPFEQIRVETVSHIPEKLTGSNYVRTAGQQNVEIVIRKSTKTVNYNRSFNKLDTYLSYIGGLVGTLIGVILFMGPYTDKSYEVSLAKKIMVDNNHQQIKSECFNLIFFVLMSVKKLFGMVGCNFDWPKTQSFIESSEEISMQMDVTYILRKLMFLDAAISKLMEKHEIQALCMRQKPSIDKAKEQRRVHFAPELFTLYRNKNDEMEKEMTEGILSPNDNIISCMFQSPNTLMKGPEKPCKIEDASALDFSQNQDEINHFTQSIMKVIGQGKIGKQTSVNILKDIIPSVLDRFGPKEEEAQERKNKDVSIVDIESIHPGQSSFEERDYDMMKVANLFKVQEK